MVRKFSSPNGREGGKGYRGHFVASTLRLCAVEGTGAARSTGNPEFFYAFFIEKFITVNGYGLLHPEGPGGGKEIGRAHV